MDFTTRFYFLFYEAWLGFLYRVRQELEKFADGLATWIQALTAQTMPENWRDYLADELADWEDKGIIVQPHGLPVLEKWILAKAKRRGTLPLGYRASEPGMVADRFADLARQYPSAVAVADTETAGFDRDSRVVFQETSPEFRAKVQRALELLDPEVAAWWQSPGVNGLVRSYDQDDYPGSSPHHSFCLVENGQAIVVVDRRFTAGRTAQGIIYLAHSGLFSFPKDANFNFRSSFSPISAAVREMRIGRDPAVLESAQSVSIVAEMAVKQSAPLKDGTLTVTAKDIGDTTWRDLLRALAAYRLPPDVRAIKIILPGRGSGPVRTILLSAHLLRAFLQLPLADRQTIMAAASSVRLDEAQASITRAVAAKTPTQNPRPGDQKLAPSTELPYNSGRNQAAPASPKPIALAAVEAEKKQPAGKSETNATDTGGLLRITITADQGVTDWSRIGIILKGLKSVSARIDKALEALTKYPCGVSRVYQGVVTTNNRLVDRANQKIAIDLIQNVKTALASRTIPFVLNSTQKIGPETDAYVLFYPLTNIRSTNAIFLNPSFFTTPREAPDVVLLHELGRLVDWLGETSTNTWKDAYVFRNMVMSLSEHYDQIKAEDAKGCIGIHSQ